MAIKILLPFLTLYMCETTFSSYTSTKITHDNRLNPGADSDNFLTIVQIFKRCSKV